MLFFYLLTMAMSILPFLDMFNETNSGCNSTHPDVESKFSAALLSCPSLAHSAANRCNAFTSSNKKPWRTAHVRPCFCRGQSGEIRYPMICKTKRHTGCIFFNHLPEKKKTLKKHSLSRSHNIFIFPWSHGNHQQESPQSASGVSHQQLLQESGPQSTAAGDGSCSAARLTAENYGPPAVSSNTDLKNRAVGFFGISEWWKNSSTWKDIF